MALASRMLMPSSSGSGRNGRRLRARRAGQDCPRPGSAARSAPVPGHAYLEPTGDGVGRNQYAESYQVIICFLHYVNDSSRHEGHPLS